MARNQQPTQLRQQVERLVTEGHTEKAYNLLKKEGWVPAGNGYHDHYPNGLKLYAKVDWEKQILVSQGGRYWTWQVNLLSPVQYTFLYPTSRQFPFDEVCSKIIRELEKRNWDVDGVEVEFDTYGSGAEKYRLVRQLTGKDFSLNFCRNQRTTSGQHLNDMAAVSKIIIPKMILAVYEDESGPSLDVYVGNNWENDRNYFVHGIKVHSKMEGKPRTYLKYKGGWQTPKQGGPHYLYRGQRPPYLVHDNDLGREYDPVGVEKTYYKTETVMDIFRLWLTDCLLAKIESVPIPQNVPLEGQLPDQPPFPDIGPIFCFVESEDARRISVGQMNPANLSPSDRYSLTGSRRFIPLDISNDNSFLSVSYDGFIWCGLGEVNADTLLEGLVIPSYYRFDNHDFFCIARVVPKSASGVYIADIAPCEVYKASVFESNPQQEYLNKCEYQEFMRTSARTLLPITEYQGGFEKPVVLINRELGLDEVELVKVIPKKSSLNYAVNMDELF